MDFSFEVEVHIYEREKLRDEVLDESCPSYGIFGPAVIPFRKNRNCKIVLPVDEKSTIGSIAHQIICDITNGDEENYLVGVEDVTFVYSTERYFTSEQNVMFLPLVAKYFDPQGTKTIKVQILICGDAGSICNKEGIRYYMHSHESGRHNEPHVHIRDTSNTYSASLAISDGRVLAGEFPPKLLKKARKLIHDEQAYFYDCWRAKTDGLVPDINHHFNLIGY